MNQHGAPDNCPDLLAKKEELVKQKELDIKQCNDQIFAIKHAEANRKQVWRNTQTGETTENCPKKIRYKYWVEGIDEVSNFVGPKKIFVEEQPCSEPCT